MARHEYRKSGSCWSATKIIVQGIERLPVNEWFARRSAFFTNIFWVETDLEFLDSTSRICKDRRPESKLLSKDNASQGLKVPYPRSWLRLWRIGGEKFHGSAPLPVRAASGCRCIMSCLLVHGVCIGHLSIAVSLSDVDRCLPRYFQSGLRHANADRCWRRR